MNYIVKRIKHLLFCHNDLGVVASDIIGNLLSVFQVDSILAHTDGKGTNRLVALFLSDGADKR